jgi:two-component system sensor histidine kinase KdpD
LREIVDRIANASRRRGARHHIEVRLPADLPMVRADATLAEQAIGNVIGNAVMHTPSSTHVVVDAFVTPNEVVLSVTDDGPGIPAQALPRVFDKFIRADVTQADGGQGTGLGLAIAKGIMEAHGGSITAESPVAGGRGTRIVLAFPRQDTPG